MGTLLREYTGIYGNIPLACETSYPTSLGWINRNLSIARANLAPQRLRLSHRTCAVRYNVCCSCENKQGISTLYLFNRNFIFSVFVLSGISLYSFYGSYAGTKSERSLCQEICVCYNETPLYTVGRVLIA